MLEEEDNVCSRLAQDKSGGRLRVTAEQVLFTASSFLPSTNLNHAEAATFRINMQHRSACCIIGVLWVR